MQGFTAHRRWKGRGVGRPVAEFGEYIQYLPANAAGKNKFEVRWDNGVWLGVRLESGESLIGRKNGVIKIKGRGFRP